MSILIRAAAAYLVLLAAVVAVNFIVTPCTTRAETSIHGVGDTQLVHGGGMVIALAASYVEKRRVDGDGSADLKRYLEANAVSTGQLRCSSCSSGTGLALCLPTTRPTDNFGPSSTPSCPS